MWRHISGSADRYLSEQLLTPCLYKCCKSTCLSRVKYARIFTPMSHTSIWHWDRGSSYSLTTVYQVSYQKEIFQENNFKSGIKPINFTLLIAVFLTTNNVYLTYHCHNRQNMKEFLTKSDFITNFRIHFLLKFVTSILSKIESR